MYCIVKNKFKFKKKKTEMPFVQRVITPKYISRSTSRLQQNNGDEQNIGCSTSCVQALPVKDNELEAVTNVTLSNALRQLASLLLTSKEIFDGLNVELQLICSRTQNIKSKINNLQAEVDKFDPKLVPVRKYFFFISKSSYSKNFNVQYCLKTPNGITHGQIISFKKLLIFYVILL